MNRAFALITILGACSTVMATDWVAIGTIEKRNIYIDMDSVARYGTQVKCWVKAVYSEPMKINNTWVTHTIARDIFDIQRRKFGLMTVHFFSDLNAPTPFFSSQELSEESVQFGEPLPGSEAELVINYLKKRYEK